MNTDTLSTRIQTVLVTGATGTIGSAVLREPTARPVRLRALTRDHHRAAGLPQSVDRVVGEPTDPAVLRRAVAGVDTVFLACGNNAGQVAFELAVIDAAAAAGVRRIVKLSAQGARPGSPVAFWDWHARIEEHLAASGIPAVVLRPSFLMSNLFAAAEHIRSLNALIAPAGNAMITMVDPADVAAAAAAALTEPGHVGHTFTLTGPAALDYQQVAAVLSAVLGRPINYVCVPGEAARSAMVDAGLPPFVAEQIAEVFAAQRAGAQQVTTSAVRMLTGRDARPLRSFAAQHAQFFGAPVAAG